MKVPAALRANEWWEYKLISIILVAYMTVLKSGRDLYSLSPWILFLFLSLVAGASYVSLINDITDIDEDLASGKKNRMAGIAPRKRWLLPAVSVILGLVFGYFYADHWPSAILYLLSWIVFSLYSIPPVRLKARGYWGVLADATGSEFFPCLLMVSFLSYKMGIPVDLKWFAAVGCWSFAFGLRGILWHQFHDLANDKKSGVKTLATFLETESAKWITWLIMGIEWLALFVMLFLFNSPIAIIALAFYAFYVTALYRILFIVPVIIQTPATDNYTILMTDFYQVFLPLAVLVQAGIMNPLAWIVLLVHLILFPRSAYLVLQNTAGFFRRITGSSSL